jgi:RNA polymerase sigma-70 factor (ECF subfamily)
MTSLSENVSAPSNFVTTRWTQVLNARGESPEARAALGELCAAYWIPIFRFVQRSGYDEEAARDLTQEFIAQLLARNGLDKVEPSKGRFRSYLLGAVKHFLSDQRDMAAAAKRGGGQPMTPLGNETDTSTTMEVPDPAGVTPDRFFDRQWAFNVIERALKQLKEELAGSGKGEYFEKLKPWLVGDIGGVSQGEAGNQLGLSEGAIKVAVHRLRKRFRALVKAEIGQTVGTSNDVQEELRYLVEVLAGG